MKKLLLIVMLMPVLIFSQSSKREEGLKVGIKGGMNLSTFYGQNTDQLTFRSSIHLGLLAEIIVSDKFSFQPELMYSGQGAFFEGNATISSSKFKYNYINLPLLGKFYIAESLGLEVGPQVGFLMNKKAKDGSGESKLEDVSFIDFSLCAGLSYDLPSGVFFQGRYIFGVTNTNTGNNAPRLSNSVLQFSVGYQF